MEHFWIVDPADVEEAPAYPAPTCEVKGVSNGRYANPEGFPLWFVVGEIEAGGEIAWGSLHGDEILYVTDGQLEIDGSICETGGVAIVEANVVATARAVRQTALVHFGPVDPEQPVDGPLGPPSSENHGVHVHDEHGISETDGGDAGHNVFYADSDCPTCRLTLLRNAAGPDTKTPSHTHSTDEMIYLLSGDIQFGSKSVEPGMGLAIVGNYRYAFRSNGGCEFLNYRRDASLYTTDPKGPKLLETIQGVRDFMESHSTVFANRVD